MIIFASDIFYEFLLTNNAFEKPSTFRNFPRIILEDFFEQRITGLIGLDFFKCKFNDLYIFQ